jgi:histidine triad (HIT) family protein
MNKCPFCTILTEKSSRLFKEYKYSFLVFSDPRLVPGHLLVIPKRHVEKLSELSQEEKTELFKLVEKYQEKILTTIASGCDIRLNYRPFMKQGRLKVNHLHFHLQPRENEDLLFQRAQRFETDLFKALPDEELQHYKELLK